VDDQGNPDPGASPVEMPSGPGFADTWFDVGSRTIVKV
jgi:peptide/nickel transport system ATP-binding protein/oligopeptide transport system ATP-binding protein